MRIEKLTGGYPGRFMLKEISFSMEEGKMHALLGLNGSGKTTILKMLCGLLKAQSGCILAGDTDLLKLDEKARARWISYVPQFSSMVYDISVLDVVLMGISPYLKPFQTPGTKQAEQAYQTLRALGIEKLADVNYQTLSGGQKRLVIIARALLQNGHYLILDEPDSSLDLINKSKLMKQIREIVRTCRKGCLISMHNPEYALNHCDAILLIKDGKVSEIDLKNEEIDSVEQKLSEVYGPLQIIQHMQKYMLYYD